MNKEEMGTPIFETENGRAWMAKMLRQLANTVETSKTLDVGQYSVRGTAKQLPDTGQVWMQQDMEDALDVNIAFRLEGIDLQKARALDAKDKRAATAVEVLPAPSSDVIRKRMPGGPIEKDMRNSWRYTSKQARWAGLFRTVADEVEKAESFGFGEICYANRPPKENMGADNRRFFKVELTYDLSDEDVELMPEDCLKPKEGVS